MAFFDPAPLGMSATEAVAKFAGRGIRVSVVAGRIRAVTHLDVDDAGIDAALAAAAALASEAKSAAQG